MKPFNNVVKSLARQQKKLLQVFVSMNSTSVCILHQDALLVLKLQLHVGLEPASPARRQDDTPLHQQRCLTAGAHSQCPRSTHPCHINYTSAKELLRNRIKGTARSRLHISNSNKTR